MNRSNSIREVAAKAEVSVGTVSNVLNRPDLVSAATRERVQAVIDDLGFVRNESARQLRAGRNRTLGLIVHSVANPYFTDLSRGVDAIADEAGLAVVLCNSDGSATREQRCLAALEEQRAQALLITPIDVDTARLVQLRDRGMAVIVVGQTAPRSDLCSARVDDVTGGDLLGSHLVTDGHRRIAYVKASPETGSGKLRKDGALRAFRRAGLPEHALTVLDEPASTVANGQAAGERIAAMRERPTAVCCANDLVALGVMHAMLDNDVKVPDDVAIVGYDDIEVAASAPVPLTTVREPRELLGRAAAELARDEGPDPEGHQHRHIIFQPELAIRASG